LVSIISTPGYPDGRDRSPGPASDYVDTGGTLMGTNNGKPTPTATGPVDTQPSASSPESGTSKPDTKPAHPEHLAKLFPDGVYSAREEEFGEQVAAIRAEAAPRGVMEKFLVDRAILAIWRLRRVALAEVAGTFDEALLRYEALAERTLFQSLERLDKIADRREAKAAKVVPPSATPAVEDGFISLRPRLTLGANAETVDVESVPSLVEADPTRTVPWKARLAFEPDISETSPVVCGTWITASHVASLVIDGWTWAELLRSHPELNEEDIRACLAYVTEEDHHDFPS